MLFGVHPSSDTYAQAVVTFVRQFGWQRFSILTEGGAFFDSVSYANISCSLEIGRAEGRLMVSFDGANEILYVITHQQNLIICEKSITFVLIIPQKDNGDWPF